MITTGTIMQTSFDDLRERIRVVFAATTRNAQGDILKDEEETRCEIWAKVLPTTATRAMTDTFAENKIVYRIVVRYRTDILPTDEIIWRGKRLTLTAPPYDAESRRVWTVLECAEKVGDYGTA